jgi:hypothetical protein
MSARFCDDSRSKTLGTDGRRYPLFAAVGRADQQYAVPRFNSAAAR